MKNKTFKNLIVIIMIVLIFANSLYVFAITNDKTQITVENFEEFKTAIKDAKDGSVIEIKGCIELTYENDTTIGYSDKRIIIKPSDEESSLKIDVTTNLIFKNTLYDENASCHLAIGASFRECIKDGFNKTLDELKNIGLNQSSEHVDFFIGTEDLEVKALLQNIIVLQWG